MYKDPLLSSLIHLKPPKMVHAPSTKTLKAPRAKPARTLDGVPLDKAYQQRMAGSRSGAGQQ